MTQTKNFYWIAALIVVMGVMHKLFVLPPIENGQDAVHKWLMMKHLGMDIGNAYWIWDHHCARWAMNLWTLISIRLFGTHPNTYYIVPLIAYGFTLYYMFRLSWIYLRDNRAIIPLILFIFFEHYTRSATQLRPALFSNLYIVVGLYYLLRYLEENAGYKALAISVVSAFMGYLTHEPDLFFLPGIWLTIFIYKRNIKDVVLHALPLFCLFLGECLVYFFATPFRFGRLELIMNNHMQGEKLVEVPFWYLFQRYRNAHFPLGTYLYMYFFSIPYLLWKFKEQEKKIQGLFLIISSYFFLKTFVQKSYFPIVLIEPFNERYLLAPIPLVLIYLVYLLTKKYSDKFHWITDRRAIAAIGAAGLVFILGTTVQLVRGEHQFIQNSRQTRLFNWAFQGGTPIITHHYERNLFNVYRVFLHDELTVSNGTYVEVQDRIVKFQLDGKEGQEYMRHALVKDPSTVSDPQALLNGCHIYIHDDMETIEEVNCQK